MRWECDGVMYNIQDRKELGSTESCVVLYDFKILVK